MTLTRTRGAVLAAGLSVLALTGCAHTATPNPAATSAATAATAAATDQAANTSTVPSDDNTVKAAQDAGKTSQAAAVDVAVKLMTAYARPDLSADAWGQAQMAVAGGGMDPSRTAYLCLLAAAGAGWSYDDVAAAAETALGMEHYRTRNRPGGPRVRRSSADRATRLRTQWDAAQAHVAMQPAKPTFREPKDVTVLDGMLRAIETFQSMFRTAPGRWLRTEVVWGGRAGPGRAHRARSTDPGRNAEMLSLWSAAL